MSRRNPAPGRRSCDRCGVRYTPEPHDPGICPDCVEILAYTERRDAEGNQWDDVPVFDRGRMEAPLWLSREFEIMDEEDSDYA